MAESSDSGGPVPLGEKYRQMIEQLPPIDATTGLPTRKGAVEQIERDFARANRHRSAICCVLLDIDHFIRFNDAHGHLAGDWLLLELGRFLCRPFASTTWCRGGVRTSF